MPDSSNKRFTDKVDLGSPSEKRSLIQARSLEEAGLLVEQYVQSQDVIETDLPNIAKSAYKDWLLFQNGGLLIEISAAAILGYLGISYILSGCLFTGISVCVMCGSAAYLSLPQLLLPFTSNPLVRWFIVTNHSYHISGIFVIWMTFVWFTYFSWFNTCIVHSKTKRSLSTTTMCLLPTGILLFLIACYRDEKGNGGFLRLIFKFILK
jgi:hypothetical protein